jgi:hypothetical protein
MPVRARDLRSNIREMGFEKGVVHTLELALEELSQLRQHLHACVEIQSQLVDQVNRFISIGDVMSKKIDQLKRDKEQGNDLDGDTP